MLVVLLTAYASPADPCSVVAIARPEELVRQADVIVLAQVEAFPGNSATSFFDRPGAVQFRVLSVLKGVYSGAAIELAGYADPGNDWNDRPVPYDFVRRGGRHGDCVAHNYRQGSQYLLLLRTQTTTTVSIDAGDRKVGALTPYWSALAPTNEQVHGADDPWVAWVRRQVSSRP
jgi:hypothetical protein